MLWYAWPRMAAFFFKDAERREDFLGTYAPFYLVTLLAVWVASLLLGWGLVFYGLRGQMHPTGLHFGDALYYAGASLLTIGYGDITADGTLSRAFSLVCAASGLAVVAVVISFLFSIFGGFQTREQFVVTIGARAGVPPSGVGFLEMHAYSGLRADLANVFREGQAWTAMVMETHLAYPTLMYFRSSHDYQSWVATLGTLLDAAALVVTTIDRDEMQNEESIGQASLMFELGRHLVTDFANYFSFMENDAHGGPGIERIEFEQAVERLQNAGYKTRDAERAWIEFSSLRSRYGLQLNALARWLEIPPAQWVGDRSLLQSPH